MTTQLEAENAADEAMNKLAKIAIPGSNYRGMAIACCCVAMGSLVPVFLLQFRVIDDLPEFPARLFNSKKIVMSKTAFPLGIPDSLLGLSSYGVTLILLFTAKPGRPWLQLALRGKLLLDGTLAARKTRKQITRFGRVCSWCMGTAAATAGVVYFARKAREAARLARA